jgi:hypothetical protein
MRTNYLDNFFQNKKFIYSTGSTFTGGDIDSVSLYDICQEMALSPSNMSAPSSGADIIINSQNLGSYDYVIKTGDITVTEFVNSEWFTSTDDTKSALVVVRGNLTIPYGQIFTPSNRKRFVVLYVDGDLTVDGTISMSGRGASHVGTSALNILIAQGTYSGITNPYIPAAGGSGGLGGIDPDGAWGGSGPGNNGSVGTNGGTGGGAGGDHYLPWYAGSSSRGGNGAAGTAYTGGTGGGNIVAAVPSGRNGSVNGGQGGNGWNYFSSTNGGPGNPTGTGSWAIWPGPSSSASDAPRRQVTGTAGTLVIFVKGTYSGTGSVESVGSYYGSGGGGGSITILSNIDNGPTPNASGGGFGTGLLKKGGNGTARKLAL